MASAVLETILQLCGEMKEAQAPCQRLQHRLADTFTQLQTLEAAKRLPPTEALGKYASMLRKYRDFLKRHRVRPLYSRIVTFEKMLSTIRRFHEEMDELVQVLGIVTSDSDQRAWIEQWEKDGTTMRFVLTGIVENLSVGGQYEVHDARAQVEAMTVLTYEMNQKDKHSDDTIRLIGKLRSALADSGFKEVGSVPSWFIARDEIEYDRTPFARGSYGAVHHGTWKSGVKVVVKTLFIDESSMTEAAWEHIVRELDRWYDLDHPHVQKMLAACHVASPPFIVYEESSEGSASKYLGSSKQNQEQMWRLMGEAALGLQYLHTSGVIHGDLRLSNILVDATGAARLADVGMGYIRSLSADSAGSYSASRAGRLRWRAPECLKRKPTTYSDIYSLAMCIVECATGMPPFAGVDDDTVYRLLRDGEMFDQPDELDEAAWSLVQSMTRCEPNERRSLSEVIDELRILAKEKTTSDGDIYSFQDTVDYATNCLEEDEFEDSESSRQNRASMQTDGAGASSFVIDGQSTVQTLLHALGQGTKECKDDAVAWIYRACYEISSCEEVQQLGGVPLLVEMVSGESTSLDTQLYALGCLQRVSNLSNAVGKSAIDEAKKRISTPSTRDLSERMEALKLPNLSQDTALRVLETSTCLLGVSFECCEALVSSGFVQAILDLLGSASDTLLDAALGAVDALAIANMLDSTVLINASVVPKLMLLLEEKEDVKQRYAGLVAMSSICEYSVDSHGMVQDANGIPVLATLLEAGRDDLAILSAQVLGHLSATQLVCAAVETAGVVDNLVVMARSSEKEVRVEAAIALSRICLHSQESACHLNDSQVLEALVECFDVGNDSERIVVTRALVRLSEDPMVCHNIENAGVVSELVESLRSGTDELKLHAVTGLSNLTQNSSDSIALVMEASAIEPLLALLEHHPNELTIAATRTISNLALSSSACKAIEKTGVVNILVKLVKEGSKEQKCHAGIALSNMCQYGNTSIQQLRHANGILPLLEMLAPQEDALPARRLTIAVTDAVAALAAAGVLDWALLRDTSVVAVLVQLVRCGDPKQQVGASRAIASLCENIVEVRDAVVDASGIKPLVLLLSSGDKNGKVTAAVALGHLSKCAAACQAMEADGIIPVLVGLVRDSDSPVKDHATIALCMMCDLSLDARVCLKTEAVLGSLLGIMATGAPSQATLVLQAMFYVTQDFMVCHKVENSGAIRRLVELIRNGVNDQKFHALRVLVNLTELGSDSLILATEASVVEPVMKILRDGNEEMKALAARMVGNLAVYLPAFRLLESNDVVPPLVDALQLGDEELKRLAVEALCKVCGHSDASCTRFQAVNGIDLLVGDLQSDNEQIVREALKLLHTVFMCQDTRQSVIDCGVVVVVLTIFEAGSCNLKTSTTPLLQSMASDESSCRDMVWAGAIDIFVQLLHGSSDAEKEVALAVLPRLACSDDARSEMRTLSVIEPIVRNAETGSSSVKRCALEALHSLAADRCFIPDVIRARGIAMLTGHLHGASEDSIAIALKVLLLLAEDEAACFRIVQRCAVPVLVGILELGDQVRLTAGDLLCRLAEVIEVGDFGSSFARVLIDDIQDESNGRRDCAKAVLVGLGGNHDLLSVSITTYLESLMHTARNGSPDERLSALRVMSIVSASRICIAPLLRVGAVGACLTVLGERDENTSKYANDTLWEIVKDQDGRQFVVTNVKFHDLIDFGRTYQWAREAVQCHLKVRSPLLCEAATSLSEVMDPYLVPSLPSRVRQCVDLSWSSLEGDDSEQTLIHLGHLVELLLLQIRQVEHENGSSIALCRLARFKLFRNSIITASGVRVIVALLSASGHGAAAAAAALATLAHDDETVRVDIVNSGGVGPLVEMACVGDFARQSEAAAALASLSQSTNAGRAIKLLGGVEALEKLTCSSNPEHRTPSRRALLALRFLPTRLSPGGANKSGSQESSTVNEVVSEHSVQEHHNSGVGADVVDKCDRGDEGYSDSYDSDDEDQGA